MDVQLLMLILSSAAGAVGVATAVLLVRDKSKAEREFLQLLREHGGAIKRARDRAMRDGAVTREELTQIIASLERASEGLSAQHRRLVAEGLHQHSLRGRARYAAKLMNKAGIASGSLPLAIP